MRASPMNRRTMWRRVTACRQMDGGHWKSLTDNTGVVPSTANEVTVTVEEGTSLSVAAPGVLLEET